MTELAERWRRLPGPARVIAAVVVAIVAIELGLAALETATGGSGPGGPDSSSYATQSRGLAAYADLLAGAGHKVSRVRDPLADVDGGSTIVIADAPIDEDELAAIGQFVERGGRLVLAGRLALPTSRMFMAGVGLEPSAATTARPVLPVEPALDLGGIGSVRTAGEGAFAGTGSARPVLEADGAPIAAVATPPSGTVVLLADASPLQNRLLAQAGNAAFGLALAGPADRPVVFAEAGHGYGQESGLDAVPSDWGWALVGGVLATLVWVWSRGRRLGPPEEDDTEPPPRRRAYVDAVAATLLRTRDPAGAIAPVQQAGREHLARRTGVAADADAELRAAATKAGVSEHDVDAIISPVRSHDDAIRAARALAHLGGSDQ
jgi:hypothetical protein